MVSATATGGTPLAELRDLTLAALDRVCAGGVPPDEVARARRQLQARIVLENNSITNVGHQVGFFETVAGPGVLAQLPARIAGVTPEDVARVAARYLATSNRTVGWFQPI
jgi:zinc protease